MVVVRLDAHHARRLGGAEPDREHRAERDRHLAEDVARAALADDALDPVDRPAPPRSAPRARAKSARSLAGGRRVLARHEADVGRRPGEPLALGGAERREDLDPGDLLRGHHVVDSHRRPANHPVIASEAPTIGTRGRRRQLIGATIEVAPLTSTVADRLRREAHWVFVEAQHRALLARRPDHYKQFTVVGILLMALLGGLGGGITRDVLVAQIPSALTNPAYITVALISGAIGYMVAYSGGQLFREGLFQFMTSFSLPWYAIMGAYTGVKFGLPVLGCLFLGVVGPTAGRYYIDARYASCFQGCRAEAR